MTNYLREFTNALTQGAQLQHIHHLEHTILGAITHMEDTMTALSDAVAQNTNDVQSLIAALKAARDLAAKYSGEPEAADINDAVAKLTAEHDAIAAALNDNSTPADNTPAADTSTDAASADVANDTQQADVANAPADADSAQPSNE